MDQLKPGFPSHSSPWNRLSSASPEIVPPGSLSPKRELLSMEYSRIPQKGQDAREFGCSPSPEETFFSRESQDVPRDLSKKHSPKRENTEVPSPGSFRSSCNFRSPDNFRTPESSPSPPRIVPDRESPGISNTRSQIKFSIENILGDRFNGQKSILESNSPTRHVIPLRVPDASYLNHSDPETDDVDVDGDYGLDQAESMECAGLERGQNGEQYSWLQCTRYKPPKLPRK